MTNQEIIDKIRRKEIDINNQSSFFGTLIKSFLWHLNSQIKIRDKFIPHYVINTGDETIYTEFKGEDETASPTEIENENYIYTKIPRCAVSPKGISLQGDQCTNPYSNGVCQYEDEDSLLTLTGEFRRISVSMSFDLEYLLDSYTDYLMLCQQLVSNLAFIRTFDITYLGQKIPCSYQLPDSLDGEYSVDFDLASTDDKRKKISLSIEVETAFPVFDNATMMLADKYIKHIYTHGSQKTEIGDPQDPDKQYSTEIKIYQPGGMDGNSIWENPHK